MSKKYAIVLMGAAWPLVGLGFHSIYFGTVPSGAAFWAVALGLCVSGCLSMALFLAVLAGFQTPFSRGLIHLGYLLFAPLGLLAALLAPGPIEASAGFASATFLLLAPVAITLYSGVTIGIGLGLTGGLAVAAHSLATRLQRQSGDPSTVRVRA
ncbi:MAG: hypothetical protein WD906_02390 [Anaerolineales bacterium]